MTENSPEVYTVTMARIYEEQGHYGKAASIYRHLLNQEPGRDDLRRALERVSSRDQSAGSRRQVIDLFRRWIDLCMKYNTIRRLKTLGYENDLSGKP